MTHHRIQIYWPQEKASLRELAARLASFLDGLSPIHPGFDRFLFHDTGSSKPVGSTESCEEALSRGTVRWKTGIVTRTSYEQRFFVDRRVGSPAAFTVTCGIEPLGLDPIWVPNKLEFLVRDLPGDERASRASLEAVMRQAIRVFDPDWGFAGTDRVPTKPLPLCTDGRPIVGWITYLRSGYPEVPRTLPKPAVPYPVEGGGTLIVATPEPLREGDRSQREAMDRVREVLESAGVLVPPAEIERG
jgi:hypothetical protein